MKLAILETNSAGNAWHLIKAANNLNIDVVFLTDKKDKYINLELNPEKICKSIIIKNSFDAIEISNFCEINQIDFIIAPGDYQLEVASEVNMSLKKYGPKLSSISLCKNKNKTREAMDKLLGNLSFMAIFNMNESKLWNKFPAIIKPLNGSGSVNVRKIETSNELEKLIPEYFNQTLNTYDFQFKNGCLIEEFIEGEEFSAECVWNKDHWEIIKFIRKFTALDLGINKSTTEIIHITVPEIENQKMNLEIIISWLDALHLKNTVAHVEFKICKQIAILIEINARLPGGRIVELLQNQSGINLAENWILSNLNMSIPINKTQKNLKSFSALANIIPPYLGTIESIDFPNHKNVHSIRNIKLPHTINSLENNDCRISSFLIEGESIDEIIKIYFEISEKVKVNYSTDK